MSYDSNIYYHPEKYGLEIVGEIEWSEPCYSFDTTVVWRDEEGRFYWASDNGCSCPSPFEDFNSLEDLEGPFTSRACIERLQICLTETNGEYASGQVFELISSIRK